MPSSGQQGDSSDSLPKYFYTRRIHRSRIGEQERDVYLHKMLMLLQPSSLPLGSSALYRALHKDSSSFFAFSKPFQTLGAFIGRRVSGWKNSGDCNNRKFFCRTAIMQEEADPGTMEEGLERECHKDLMLVSDLDFTMVDHEDPSHQSLLSFNSLWAAEYARNSILVYSTGRSVEKYIQLRQQVPLLTPAIVVLSVGTEIFYGQSLKPDLAWQEILDEGWDRDIVLEEAGKFPQLRLQEDSEQRSHKVSFYLDKQDAPNVQHELLSRLQQRGIKVKLIYSGGIALDALPKMGGKGEALTYILRKMKNDRWQSKNVLVCGDSGNDTELFLVEGVNGVIVSNAQEELVQWYKSHNSVNHVYHASQRCAGGIIQALHHFDFGPHISPRERIKDRQFLGARSETKSGISAKDGSAQREVVEFNVFLELWLSGKIPNTDENYQRAVKVIANGATMVYPWGIETNLKESLDLVRQKHGLMIGNGFMTWIDNIEEKQLGDGVYLVTWQSWERFEGGVHKGYYATAILLSKEETPNGVQWLRVHETPRKVE